MGSGALELPNRRLIYDCIRDNPGAHLRQVARDSSTALGTVLYHLDYLTRAGMLVTVQDGRFRRFFVANTLGREEKNHIVALQHRGARAIARLLLDREEAGQAELSEGAQMARSTLSYHLSRMVAQEVLSVRLAGAEKHYRLRAPDLSRKAIERFSDEAVGPAAPLGAEPSEAGAAVEVALSPAPVQPSEAGHPPIVRVAVRAPDQVSPREQETAPA
jgi:DNA-binding transcriptional ArsR family regulator